jgi:hypothetical protein
MYLMEHQVKRAMVSELEVIANMAHFARIDVKDPTKVLKYLELLDEKVRILDQLLTLELACDPPTNSASAELGWPAVAHSPRGGAQGACFPPRQGATGCGSKPNDRPSHWDALPCVVAEHRVA